MMIVFTLLRTLEGCDVAKPTRQIMRQTRNTAPGAIPRASGLSMNTVTEHHETIYFIEILVHLLTFPCQR